MVSSTFDFACQLGDSLNLLLPVVDAIARQEPVRRLLDVSEIRHTPLAVPRLEFKRIRSNAASNEGLLRSVGAHEVLCLLSLCSSRAHEVDGLGRVLVDERLR